jgi:hypothetical protein
MLYSPATGGGPMAQPLIQMVQPHLQLNIKSEIDPTRQVALTYSSRVFFH